jgi:hypothetical protein
MRLYNNLKPLASGETAGINNKGVLICNTDVSDTVTLEVINCDNTIAGLTLTIGPGVSNPSTPLNPSYFIFPFKIKRWTANSSPMNGYELY